MKLLFSLMLKGLRNGKARFACAVAGVAIATGTMVFMTSFVATNRAQAPFLAEKACAPWAAWRVDGIQVGFGRGPRGNPPVDAHPSPVDAVAHRVKKDAHPSPVDAVAHRVKKDAHPSPVDAVAHRVKEKSLPPSDLRLSALALTIDYRPGGHVLQGPPMMAFLAAAPAENPYAAVKLTEGRWVDESSADFEVVCVRTAMRRFGAAAPKLGETLKFVGRGVTMSAKIVGYMDGGKLPAQFPYVFANRPAFAALGTEKIGTVSFYRTLPKKIPPELLTSTSPTVLATFIGDEQRRMDYATPLLIIAALLTAIALLVNSLLLSIESNRATLSTLRTVGLTRLGVVGFVTLESIFASIVGWFVGVVGSLLALAAYVAADAASFPAGMAMDEGRIVLTLVVLPFVVIFSVLFALAPALKVRGMDAAARRPRRRRRGMAITFACGFAAFVAVEVWGASLMRAFVPSAEWPDAIVSILPAGVSSWDVEKLRDVKGVKRISELIPRQCFFPEKGDAASRRVEKNDRPRFGRPNALFLAAEWLPKFNFIEGTWEEADAALQEGASVVITEMMMNARHLHKGDELVVMTGGRRGPPEELRFKVAGVVDLNWHMVTSRGLVRGLNGAPGMTDGPVFCSFDTIGIVDPRTYMTEPAMSAPMTHLWVEYDEAFLAEHGVFEAGRLIEAEIAKKLGNPVTSTVRLHARDEIADGTLAHGTNVIGQAARVPFVFLAILAIGFVAMLVAEADARRREFVLLRAVGATQSQLVGRLAWTAVKTALLGMVIGLPVGSFLGWLTSLKTGSMWPGLPHWFVIPWQVTLEGALGALLFALIFALPTSLTLIRRLSRR